MEHFLRCYLEHFDDLPRTTLHDRRNRKHMVEYISTMIQGCSTVDNDDVQITCSDAIETILEYHTEKKNDNGSVCRMGKYHNILYVAMKLCYLWQLKNTEIVCALLNHIYSCEGTFERILVGAIFGNSAPHYIAGWKSDFDNQEENLRAVVYFIDKANASKLELPFESECGIRMYRFIDLPIESCGKASPLKITVQLGLPDKLHILLRFGALVYQESDVSTTIVEHLLGRLSEFNHCYPYNLVACLALLLRAIPSIQISSHEKLTDEDYKVARELYIDKYKDLIEDGLIPISRCGFLPPELKHLCRFAIRQRLWENYELPQGIRNLPLPESLWKYLDILED